MEHVDEGTIHAWLDGALPANEGEQLEAHIAGCASCAAAVAEARGLIAASSRILSALDDVPGGVIPRASVEESARPATAPSALPATGATSTSAAGPRPAGGATRRPWYRRPQYAAAAGIAFVALTTTVLLQRVGVSGIGDSAETAAEMRAAELPQADVSAPAATATAIAESVVTDAASSNARPADVATMSTADAADAVAPESSAPKVVLRKESGPEASRRDASGAGATPVVANVAVPPTEGKAATEQSAPAPVPAPSPARRDTVRSAIARAAAAARSAESLAGARALVDRRSAPAAGGRADTAERLATTASAPRPSAPNVAAPPVPVGAARTADSAPTAKRALVVSPDSISRSERLRVAGERDVQLQSVVVTGSGASRLPSGANASRPATPAALAGCYRLQPAAGADVATLGDFVTLQTVELAFAAAGSDEARPAYVARDLAAADGATAGGAASLRWTLSTSGQVILVRGEGATLRRVPLRIAAPEGEARSAGAPAAGTMAAERIDCPPR